MAEASLEGVPTTISPIAVTTRSRSITLPTDMAELQENANKALEELLATRSSIDAHRWRAIWELGMELHQNESKTTESIKEARAICSHVTLDARALCFTTVNEAKTTEGHTIWEAEAACSVAIRMQRPGGPPRWSYPTGNMAKSCKIWRNKSSERKADAKLTSSLPVRLPYMPAQ